MTYYSSKSDREAPDPSRLSNPRKLLLFLNKLAARHISEFGAIAKGLESLANGQNADIASAYIPSDKLKLTAHLLSTIGQSDETERVSMLAKACSIAIEDAPDRDAETMTQLVEALEVLSADDVGNAPPQYDIEALRAQFNGSQVEISQRNGTEYYTFRGRAAYPAEITIGKDLYRLCNASYRKGIYQKV